MSSKKKPNNIMLKLHRCQNNTNNMYFNSAYYYLNSRLLDNILFLTALNWIHKLEYNKQILVDKINVQYLIKYNDIIKQELKERDELLNEYIHSQTSLISVIKSSTENNKPLVVYYITPQQYNSLCFEHNFIQKIVYMHYLQDLIKMLINECITKYYISMKNIKMQYLLEFEKIKNAKTDEMNCIVTQMTYSHTKIEQELLN